jgi:hypothetical protein
MPQYRHIKPFLCPPTKEVMKNPWFAHCREESRNPTCPVTVQVLKSLEACRNISLSGIIEQWVGTNVDICIKIAIQH